MILEPSGEFPLVIKPGMRIYGRRPCGRRRSGALRAKRWSCVAHSPSAGILCGTQIHHSVSALTTAPHCRKECRSAARRAFSLAVPITEGDGDERSARSLCADQPSAWRMWLAERRNRLAEVPVGCRERSGRLTARSPTTKRAPYAACAGDGGGFGHAGLGHGWPGLARWGIRKPARWSAVLWCPGWSS